MIQSRTHAGPDALRTVTPDDPARAYADADPADRPVFFRGEDPLLQVWILDDDRCHVARRSGGQWFDLIASDAPGDVEIIQGAVPATVPAASLTPRDRGLELLQETGDRTGRWRPVPEWVIHDDFYPDRDFAEAHWQRAVDLSFDLRFGDESGDDLTPGLRGLAWLCGIHNATMANGLNDALEGHTPEQVTEAVELATRIGLHDIAALITTARTAEPSDDNSRRYADLSRSRKEEDASAILDAVRRDLIDHPGYWGL